ncbi:MAG: hypothetical protein F2667_10950 [Actinobacteria bacterium]|uniref:Unannotated protein n=1 Tax=freshwater metagenome TaxID=449393 RepID=A0A6J6RK39_9ZZZZ|nr:hypothetical protein [Actinomycetota bacterium]
MGQTAAVYVLVGIAQRSLALLILPFVTRVLSPGDYGRVSIVVTVLTLVGVIFAASLEVPLFRALARGGGGDIVRWSRAYTVYWLPGTCVLLATLLGVLDVIGVAPQARLWAIELASAGLVAALTYFGLPILRATDQLARYFILAAGWMACLVGTKLLFLGWLLPGPIGWVTSDLVSAGFAWLMVVLLVRAPVSDPAAPRPADEPRSPWALVRMCAPLVPHRLSFWALTSLSRPALVLVVSISAVGLFSFAVSVAAISMLLLAELNRSVLLEYSRETFPAPTASTGTIVVVQATAAVAIPALLALGVSLTGTLLVGSDYYTAIPIVGLLLLGQVAYGIYLIPMNFLVQTAGLFKWSSLASVFGAAVILGSILLAGSQGSLRLVAVGNSIGYAAMCVAAFVLVRIAGLQISWRRCVPALPVVLLLVGALVTGVVATAVFPDPARFGWAGVGVAMVTVAGAISLGPVVGQRVNRIMAGRLRRP